jgi:hypothetical protein
LLLAGAVVAAALFFGLSNHSAGQPKPDGDDRLGRLEKRLDQLEKAPANGRWQMQTVVQESVTTPVLKEHQPQRYISGHTVYLLDSQTGTVYRLLAGGKPVQIHPEEKK